jgi:hypothetical protein
MSKTYKKKIEDWAHKSLVGKKIKAVEYMDEEEKENMYWKQGAMVFELDDGILMFASSDEEGNEAGSMYIQLKNKEEPVLEVIPAI